MVEKKEQSSQMLKNLGVPNLPLEGLANKSTYDHDSARFQNLGLAANESFRLQSGEVKDATFDNFPKHHYEMR